MRVRFRFHLSSLIAASFVAGLVLWANSLKNERLFPLSSNLGICEVGSYCKFGWPMAAYISVNSVGWGGSDENNEVVRVRFRYPPAEYEKAWVFDGVLVDAIVLAATVIATIYVLESRINRRALNVPQIT